MVTLALILALAGVAADAVTTVIGLRRGYIEGNPIAPHGVTGVITLNIIMALGIIVAAQLAFGGPFVYLPLLGLAVWKFFAAALNIRTMWRER